MRRFLKPLAIFRRDTRGTIAVLTAIMIFPLLVFSAGVPIDLARQVQFHSSLQNIADGAALAGAAVLGEGATAAQACAIANAFVKASAYTGLAVPYSSLTPAGAFATTASFTTVGQAALPLGCSSNAPNTSTLSLLESTTPNQVTVTISGNMPTTFMSFLKKSLPVTVAATAVGPSNVTTICVLPAFTPSADYNALYYYAVGNGGTLYNVGADGSAPTTFSEASASDPSLTASKSQFLEDNSGNKPTYNISPATSQCSSGYSEVFIHLPIATRLGFEMASEKGGHYPCYYATKNILTGLGYSGNFFTGDCLVGGAIPLPFVQAISLFYFNTDSYGTHVFGINRYYSTDYPTTLNSSSTQTVPTGFTPGDFSGTNQERTANTVYNQNPSNQKAGTHITYFISRAAGLQPSNADIVCEVNAGALVTPASVTQVPAGGTPGTANYVSTNYTNITLNGPAQQENLVVQNSSQGAIYKCPTVTPGDPYNIDPTCKELNGATLTAGWNDMGGPGSDDVNYGDMPYSFQCVGNSGIATLDYANTVLNQ